ncbi:MAG TPA: hypothetical protein VFV38_17900 [Ktedonobacteraceae bacterium]|nr:hypothetical protein [Ktedonobacteraceae bacterium]
MSSKNQKCFDTGIETQIPAELIGNTEYIQEKGRLLRVFLRERVAAHLLDEQDERILLLRLGLEDNHCYTLNETAAILEKSPETIRRRQYLTLRRAIKDIHFFKLFREYASVVPLPKGITYYLYKFSEYTDTH